MYSSFVPSVITAWNTLPNSIKHSWSISAFKRSIQCHFFGWGSCITLAIDIRRGEWIAALTYIDYSTYMYIRFESAFRSRDGFSLAGRPCARERGKCKHKHEQRGCSFSPWFSTGELTPQGCCQWRKQEGDRSGQAAFGECIQRWDSCDIFDTFSHKLVVALKALFPAKASPQTRRERLWTKYHKFRTTKLLTLWREFLSNLRVRQSWKWWFTCTVH